MDWPHLFKIPSNLIHMVIPFSYFRDGVRTAINVYISTVMASPCFINVWITANSNGQKMKMKYVIFLKKSSDGSSRGYLSSSQRRFSHHQKASSKFTKTLPFIFIPLFKLDIIGRVNPNEGGE